MAFFKNLKPPVHLIMGGEPERCEMAYQYINTRYWHFRPYDTDVTYFQLTIYSIPLPSQECDHFGPQSLFS